MKKAERIRPRTTDTRWLTRRFIVAQSQIPVPDKYLELGFRGLAFVEIMVD